MIQSTRIAFCETDFLIDTHDDERWRFADRLTLDRYWNGEPAEEARHCEVRMLWSDTGLYIKFGANQREPLIVFDDRDVTQKRIGLWERDVCELFIAPDTRNRRRYFEFEIAPTSEWLDLIVDWSKDEPRDWDYVSGMELSTAIEPGKVTMAMKIPWTAFGKKPEPGDVWLGNLFRQVGSGDTRGYLAWSPTMTQTPNFHVPEKFGEFVFGD